VKGKEWIRKVEGFARRARGVWLSHFLNSQSELTLCALPLAFHPSPLSFTLYPLPFTLHSSLFIIRYLLFTTNA
jgi:hypothetical protein